MCSTATVFTRRNTARAQQLARQTADQFFAALAPEIPFDNAPGEVDLIAAANSIQDAILQSGTISTDPADNRESAALHAGYLLGVKIGRRMAGGAR